MTSQQFESVPPLEH